MLAFFFSEYSLKALEKMGRMRFVYVLSDSGEMRKYYP